MKKLVKKVIYISIGTSSLWILFQNYGSINSVNIAEGQILGGCLYHLNANGSTVNNESPDALGTRRWPMVECPAYNNWNGTPRCDAGFEVVNEIPVQMTITPPTAPVYRFSSPNWFGRGPMHINTWDFQEGVAAGLQYDGIAFKAIASPFGMYADNPLRPIAECVSNNNVKFFTYPDEPNGENCDKYSQLGYNGHQALGYVYTKPGVGLKKLYRYWLASPQTNGMNDDHFTAVEGVTPPAGYVREDIVLGYVPDESVTLQYWGAKRCMKSPTGVPPVESDYVTGQSYGYCNYQGYLTFAANHLITNITAVQESKTSHYPMISCGNTGTGMQPVCATGFTVAYDVPTQMQNPVGSSSENPEGLIYWQGAHCVKN